MNELMFGWAHHNLCEEAGGEGGGGTGGGTGGAGAGGTGGAGGGDGGAGGSAGGVGGTGGGSLFAGAGNNAGGEGAGANGEGGEGGQGALGGGKGGEGGEGEIAWDKITDAELFAKVKMPEVEGVKINSEFAAKRYGEFCRKHHISPEAISEFMKLEGDGYAKALKEGNEATAKKVAEVKANFEAQGKALHEAYSDQQIGVAVNLLKSDVSLNADKDFMQMVTGPMSNNKTMVALLLNWAETHKGDQNTGAGSGSGGTSEKGFAARWTGQNI